MSPASYARRSRSCPAWAGSGRPRWPPNSSTGTGTTTTSSGGFAPSTTTGSGTRWSGWARNWNCGRRSRAAAAIGPSRPCWKPWDRESCRAGCWSTTTRPSRSSCRGTCPRACPAGTSSSPRGCRPGPATSRPTTSKSPCSPPTKRSACCAAGYPRWPPAMTWPARRTPGARREAGRLAAVLGGLPLATEHAAAYLSATDQSADDYITGFEAHLRRLDEQPAEFPAPVLAALGDVGRAAERGRPAPVQPVRVLLSGADRGGVAAAERRRPSPSRPG